MLSLNPPLLWLVAGAVLCLMELIFPTAFTEFMMGISAIIVAALALFIPYTGLQLVLWLLLSVGLIILSRRWLTPKTSREMLKDAQEGETLTEIQPGQPGRVLYEGNSWRAMCADDKMAIAAHQSVYVIKRQGNTLIVLPTDLSLLPGDNYHPH